jgi:hypothetical protein
MTAAFVNLHNIHSDWAKLSSGYAEVMLSWTWRS